MVRVFDYAGYGLCVKMAAMSWRQAENHVKGGQELLARKDSVQADEWFQRVVGAVETSLKCANDTLETFTDDSDPRTNTLDWLKDNFDIPTLKKAIPAMYDALMEESGLKTAEPGSSGGTDFSKLRCRLITETGYTPAEVDDMPFAEAVALFNYWSAEPTVSMMLRAFFGIENSTLEAPKPSEAEQQMAMAALRQTQGNRKVRKMKDAPERDRAIFERMKEKANG